VRELSPSEGRVIRVLLAAIEGETARVAAAGVPRSTYHVVRRRSYAERWVRTCLVPDPSLLGARTARFSLSRPYAGEMDALAASLAADPDTVLLWAGLDLVVSVALEGEPAGSHPRAPPPPSLEGTMPPRAWTIHAEAGPAGVPIFFDFEGAWDRWTNAGNPLTYPVPLGLASSHGRGEDSESARAALRRALQPLLDLREEEGGSLSARLDGLPLSSMQQRLFRDTWVRLRVFPNLQRIPAYEGRHLDRVLFVTGALRGPATAASLSEGLMRDGAVAPFLFAHDRRRVLIGLIAERPARPLEGALPAFRLLKEALDGIEVEREPVETLRVLVDHRYRLLAAPNGG
jgi:hypothetical protein